MKNIFGIERKGTEATGPGPGPDSGIFSSVFKSFSEKITGPGTGSSTGDSSQKARKIIRPRRSITKREVKNDEALSVEGVKKIAGTTSQEDEDNLDDLFVPGPGSEVALPSSVVTLLSSEVALPSSEVALSSSEVALPSSVVTLLSSEVALPSSEVTLLSSEVAAAIQSSKAAASLPGSGPEDDDCMDFCTADGNCSSGNDHAAESSGAMATAAMAASTSAAATSSLPTSEISQEDLELDLEITPDVIMESLFRKSSDTLAATRRGRRRGRATRIQEELPSNPFMGGDLSQLPNLGEIQNIIKKMLEDQENA